MHLPFGGNGCFVSKFKDRREVFHILEQLWCCEERASRGRGDHNTRREKPEGEDEYDGLLN